MKIIKLSIYSVQTKPITKGEKKNFLKGGKLSRHAVPTIGSFTETMRDNESLKWKIQDLLNYGYKNIHTGYIDSALHMEKDGEQYIGWLTLINNSFPDGITLGFSSYK